jgi:hypothetical protein
VEFIVHDSFPKQWELRAHLADFQPPCRQSNSRAGSTTIRAALLNLDASSSSAIASFVGK